MRPALLLALVAAAIAGGLWFLRTAPDEGVPRETIEAPTVDREPVEVPVDDAGRIAAPVEPTAPVDAEASRGEEPLRRNPGPLVSFHGSTAIQPKGEALRAAFHGELRLTVIVFGEAKEQVAKLTNGRFEVEVPSAATVRVEGGTLDGERVHFLETERLLRPRENEYLLVGQPIPDVVLIPMDGDTEVPLAGVDVRLADGATAAGATTGDRGPLLVEGGASPITLPHIPAEHVQWLHLEKDGYAPASVLVDPNVEARHEVTMFPSASMTLRITGPGRSRADVLVLHRLESDERTPHAATFQLNGGDVKKENDALVIDITGLAARPHRFEVKGFDLRGRATSLASGTVELEAGAMPLHSVRIDG